MSSRKLLLMLVGVLAVLAFAACAPIADSGAGGEAAPVSCAEVEITETDGGYDMDGCILRVAVENAYQPFNYINTDSGEAVGYDYDIFAAICETLNCEPDFIETSWDAMVAVMGGEGEFETFDVGADGITITEERAQNVNFTQPFITSAQVLLVGADEERFSEPDEFAADENLIIGTQLGTTNYMAAESLVGADRITAYDQFGTAVQALINGDVDAVMIDNVAGIGYVGVNSDKLKITGEAVQSEELGFIVGQNSQLLDPLNAALDALAEDGTLDTLFEEWFSTDEEQ